jgi:hypothetical protein
MTAMRRPYMTPRLADRQRDANRRYLRENATQIAALAGQLRAHARRCRTEPGYKSPLDLDRKTGAEAIAGLAAKLDDRARLRLSIRWWLERATTMLAALDKANGRST